MTGTAGFNSLDATATGASRDDELRFARASVAHLRRQADLLAGQAAAVAEKSAQVIAAHEGKTAEAQAIADRAAADLTAAETVLAELEG